MPDPYIICCIMGTCCDDGSQDQQDALAQFYRDEMPKHSGAAYTPGLEVSFARMTLEHFTLVPRKELPPGVAPGGKPKKK